MRKEIIAPTVEPEPEKKSRWGILKLPDRTVVGKKSALDNIKIEKDIVIPKEAYDIIAENVKEPIPKPKLKSVVIKCLEGFLGGLLIAFGIINSGNFREVAAKLGGEPAMYIQLYQGGVLLMILGSIIIYDVVKGVK
jgi:hypothetical protein